MSKTKKKSAPKKAATNYLRLLERYMARVIDAESIAYITAICGHKVTLSEREVEQLKAIEKRVRKKNGL